MAADPLIVISKLAEVFDRLQIQYVVGGSMASSMYGIPRATQDVDLMASIKPEQVDQLTEALESEFYVSAELILDAIRRLQSFNVIHLPTMFKADVFIAENSEWSHEEMNRARTEVLDPETAVQIRSRAPKTPFSTNSFGMQWEEGSLTNNGPTFLEFFAFKVNHWTSSISSVGPLN